MSNQDPLGNPTSKPPRKVKFQPKAPPRRNQKPILPKPEKVEDANFLQEELLRRLQEDSAKGKSKPEKKSMHTQVAFGSGGASSMRSYGVSKSGISKSQGPEGGVAPDMKEYKEPWDYYSYYPVTVPLRRPYSGNPERLDEEEFGESTETTTYNENSINAAKELGLMEENLEASMFFLQLPETMPLFKQPPVKTEDQETAGGSKPSKGSGTSTNKPCSLSDLPPGYMGKMLVYKSGAVKMKLGDTLFDVSPGLNCAFAQDAVAINTEEKLCCNLGELNNRATITPDIDYMLANMPEL